MSNVQQHLIARADEEGLARWLERHGAPPFNGPPHEHPRARLKAAIQYSETLRNGRRDIHSALMRDAERVMEMGSACRDWLVTQTLEQADLSLDDRLQQGGPEARALHLFLNDETSFAYAERRASFLHYSDQRSHASRYVTDKIEALDLSEETTAHLQEIAQEIYRNHDSSGEFINLHIDHIDQREQNENYNLLVTLSISRAPAYDQEFNQSGKLTNQLRRKVTSVHVAVDTISACLMVTADRGGAPVRQAIANAFAKLLLGQNEDPAVIAGEDNDLEAVLGKKAEDLFIDAEGVKRVRVAKIEVESNQLPGSSVIFQETRSVDAWDVLAAITGAPRNELPGLTLLAVDLVVDFEEGIGVQKRSEQFVRCAVTRNSVKGLNSGSARHRYVRDEVLPRLGLTRRSETLAA